MDGLGFIEKDQYLARKGGVVMEKKREDKCIILSMPKSQWMFRKGKQLRDKVFSTYRRMRGK